MLSNLDIMTSDLPFGKVDAIYTDPPWGSANLKYWRTMNGERGAAVDWQAFLNRLFTIFKTHCPFGPWYIETGTRFVTDVIDASPISCSKRWKCRYRAGSKWLPNVLLLFGGVEPKATLAESKRTGLPLVLWALGDMPPGSTVLDPCCGLGTTAKACLRLGLNFCGNELNPNRLERTRKILERRQ